MTVWISGFTRQYEETLREDEFARARVLSSPDGPQLCFDLHLPQKGLLLLSLVLLTRASGPVGNGIHKGLGSNLTQLTSAYKSCLVHLYSSVFPTTELEQ